jgi:hypothetical protein
MLSLVPFLTESLSWQGCWFVLFPAPGLDVIGASRPMLLFLCLFLCRPDALSSRSRPRAAPLTPRPRGTLRAEAGRKRLIDRFALPFLCRQGPCGDRPIWASTLLPACSHSWPGWMLSLMVSRVAWLARAAREWPVLVLQLWILTNPF